MIRAKGNSKRNPSDDQSADVSASTPSNEPRLKILMIAPTSFFSDYGGHIRIFEETLALRARGHQVTIVTYQQGRDLPDFDIRRTLPVPYRADYEVGSSRHKVAFDVLLAWEALRVALFLRPDVIHGHMHEGALIGTVLARLFGKPLVFDFQGSLTGEMVDHGYLKPRSSIFYWMHKLERAICRWSPAILTSSIRAKHLLMREFEVAEEKIQPLPDCVDLSRFDPALFSAEQRTHLRTQLGIPDGRTIVTYLGLLADYQGTHHLVQAAKKLKDQGRNIHFLIMGYPAVERYKEQAAELDVLDYVTFTGKVPYDDAPYYLSLGDISVSAKMSATEGSGKVLNYMAMAQPIVAYDSQVHREYLGELGIYPPSGDVESFSAEIAKLADNPKQCRKLGELLRQRAANHYNWGVAANDIVSLYQRLAK
ncbi:MAG: glycosyltransferase family 4 protein [Candidatus Promineifilaceae bacterium]